MITEAILTTIIILSSVTGDVADEQYVEDKCAYDVVEVYDDQLVLTPNLGVIDGPQCTETCYNLDMTGVLEKMYSLGYEYTYWVREDGVKMFGDYVMVAADLDLFPRGTIVETSLGLGIVCDTGEFIYDNPHQFDIATTW